MWMNRVTANLIDSRIDSEYYEPAVFVHLEKLARWHPRPMSDFVDDIRSEPPIHTDHYGSDGIHIVSPTNFTDFQIDLSSTNKLARQHKSLFTEFLLQPGRLLYALVGDVGHACVVPDPAPEAISYRRTANVKLKGIDPYFVCCFLNIPSGSVQLKRMTTGVIQDQVRLEDSAGVLLPTVDEKVQKYIGDLLRTAERLKNRSSHLLSSATKLVERLVDRTTTEKEIALNGLDASTHEPYQQQDNSARVMHTRPRCSDLTNRIDAWYYQPHLVAAYEKITESGCCQTLAEVIDPERDVKGGATPLGAEYSKQGTVRFYRTSDVSGLAVQVTGSVFLSDEQDREMSRSRLAEGDVLLTITGADFGHAGAITKHHLPGNISQHSVRFRPTIDESYLVAYLESKYGQLMLWRQAYGATRPAIDYPGVKSLLIRVPDPSVQRIIGDAVRCGVLAREYAMSLISAAKLVVEALIEGKVSDAELKAAQDDRESNLELLRRLTPKGLDVAGDRPLFDDFEGLQKMIEESRQAQSNDGEVR